MLDCRVSLQAFRQARPFLGEGSGAFCLLFTLSSSLLEPPKNVSYLNIPDHGAQLLHQIAGRSRVSNTEPITHSAAAAEGSWCFLPFLFISQKDQRANVIDIQMLTINVAALLSYSILNYLNQNRRTPAPPRTPRGLHRRCPES